MITSYDLPATISRGWPWLGPVNLDWECQGNHQKITEFLWEKGILNFSYNPEGPGNINDCAIRGVMKEGINSITLGNVLNNYSLWSVRKDILRSIRHNAEEYGSGIFCKLLVSMPIHEHPLTFYHPEMVAVFGESLVAQEKGFLWAMIPTKRGMARFMEQNFNTKEGKG